MKPKYDSKQGFYYVYSEEVRVRYITQILIDSSDTVSYILFGPITVTEQELENEIKCKPYFLSEIEAQKELLKKLPLSIKEFTKKQTKLINQVEKRIKILSSKKPQK